MNEPLDPVVAAEIRAWQWLLSLERLPIEVGIRRHIGQIRVEAAPGELGASKGAPLVRVSVAHPGLTKRVVETGNTLQEAVSRVQNSLWRQGIRLPHPHNGGFTPEEARSVEARHGEKGTGE